MVNPKTNHHEGSSAAACGAHAKTKNGQYAYMVAIPAAAPWSVVIPLLLLFAFCSRFNI
jgi:hypothetical protein